jgi:hypothetical protein
LDEHKGPINRSKSKQLHLLEVENHPFEEKEKPSDMTDRENPRDER